MSSSGETAHAGPHRGGQVTIDSPFFAALVLAFASILVVGLSEVLADRRLAILAVVMMVVALGIVCCTMIIA
jgi:hypothetical protein